MSKELWEEQVFPENEQDNKRQHKTKAAVKTPILTILLSIFFMIVVGILGFILYTSNGNTDREQAITGFYDETAKQQKPSDSNQTTISTETTTSSMTTMTEPFVTSMARTGGTTTVMAGEGAGQIAARLGISVDQLYALNPDKLVGPGGTWWANPGDVVYGN